jgi:hypothetical protein
MREEIALAMVLVVVTAVIVWFISVVDDE